MYLVIRNDEEFVIESSREFLNIEVDAHGNIKTKKVKKKN